MTHIRSASTVILIRKRVTPERNGFQIYLMKRPKSMRSFQSYTVFPGGLLESQDQEVEWQQYIHNKLNTYTLLPKRFDYPDRTFSMTHIESVPELPFVVAAIREVFEETGILLCQSEQKSPQHPTLQLYRQALLNKEITFLEMIKKLDIYLDAERLIYIGRRVTPPPTTIYFDANFYLAMVPADTESIPSEKEVASDTWIEPSVALKLVEEKEMICAPATIECFHVLNSLSKPVESLWWENQK